MEKEGGKMIPFTTASKTIKYVGINLIKEVKDLYTKSLKTLRKPKRMSEAGEASPAYGSVRLIL